MLAWDFAKEGEVQGKSHFWGSVALLLVSGIRVPLSLSLSPTLFCRLITVRVHLAGWARQPCPGIELLPSHTLTHSHAGLDLFILQ